MAESKEAPAVTDASFSADKEGLTQAVDALLQPAQSAPLPVFEDTLPETGMDEAAVLRMLEPLAIGGAQPLGSPTAFAHMDPPTPWITWATTLWNAALNQNLLHPHVAPAAREIEARVIRWLSPVFGMTGGHMTPGSTVANLTALWAARELRGVKRVCASAAAHVSVPKAAHILGLDYVAVEVDGDGCLDVQRLPVDLSATALVLTAGTTSAGSIDPLAGGSNAAWTHVDAAWAGPLRLSARYRDRLAGIEKADSIAVSTHKWLFQPKESGLVLFRDVAAAHDAVSFGAEYLSVPNVGVLGSRGASALPLLATLLVWGREGVEARIDRAMALAGELHEFLSQQTTVRVHGPNVSGVVLWQFAHGEAPRETLSRLPPGAASLTTIGGQGWIRHVAANPVVDMAQLKAAIGAVPGFRA